jgi:membrane protein
LQWGYVNVQSLLTGYGAIYGTFAALPLFMIWLELSWLIVLLGGEISFAYQNASLYEQEAEPLHVSHRHRRVLILFVMHRIVRNFMEGLPPMNAAEISDKLGIPVRIVRELVNDLLNTKIIIETVRPDVREVAYQPALDPSKITISFIIDSLEKQGQQITFDTETEDLIKLNRVVDSFYQDINNSAYNTALKDL